MGSSKYKRPFYRTSTFQIHILPFFALIYILIKHIDALAFWEWSRSESIAALIVFALFIGPFIYVGIFQQLYFIELSDDDFVLRNGLAGIVKIIIPLSKEYEVLVGYNKGSTVHYIMYRKSGRKRWGWFYGIDLVDPKDLKEIISILETKGVTVITKDLKDI